MPEQQPPTFSRPGLPRLIALMVLAGISGGIVWSFHALGSGGFAACLIVGGIVGFMAAGLVGVHLVSAVGTMAVCAGIIEGVVEGWSRIGFLGAILGGLVGIVAGTIVMMLPLMLAHLVMIVFGRDPFAGLVSSRENDGKSPE